MTNCEKPISLSDEERHAAEKTINTFPLGVASMKHPSLLEQLRIIIGAGRQLLAEEKSFNTPKPKSID